jgi:hypothetical protein
MCPAFVRGKPGYGSECLFSGRIVQLLLERVDVARLTWRCYALGIGPKSCEFPCGASKGCFIGRPVRNKGVLRRLFIPFGWVKDSGKTRGGGIGGGEGKESRIELKGANGKS